MAFSTRSKRPFEQSIRADYLNTPAPRPQKRRRSGSASPSPTSTPQQPTSTPCRRPQRRTYMSSRQKADDILKYMHDQHRWGVKDLIKSFACDSPEDSKNNTKNNY